MMEEKNVLLSIKDLEVKFNVRGRILTAIRKISLDIMENESIAIVGESGSGKSVFTKTFAGMLDANGFISNGDVIFNDAELVDTVVNMDAAAWKTVAAIKEKLDHYARYENGADTYNALAALKEEKVVRSSISPEEAKRIDDELDELAYQRTECFNLKQTYDPHTEKDKINAAAKQIQAAVQILLFDLAFVQGAGVRNGLPQPQLFDEALGISLVGEHPVDDRPQKGSPFQRGPAGDDKAGLGVALQHGGQSLQQTVEPL